MSQPQPLSQRLVDFIATLRPLYVCQRADGHDCALSLVDGTLLMPLDESHAEREEGWIAVLWQGDEHRRSELPGPLLAQLAVQRHAELHGAGLPPAEAAAHRDALLGRLRRLCGEPLLSLSRTG